MADFSNVDSTNYINGRFFDTKGTHIVVAQPSSSGATSFVKSNDNGDTFTTMSIPMSRLTSIRVSQDGEYIFIFSTIMQKFYTSSDGGANWTQQLSDTIAAIEWLQCSNSGQYVVFSRTGANMTYVSNDYGVTATGTSMKSKRCDMDSTGQYIGVVGIDGQDIIFNMSNDFGATWTEQTISGNGNDPLLSISADGQYVLITSSNKNIYRSIDYGVSFSEVSGTTQEWAAIEISVLDPRFQYAALWNQTNTVWESLDYGETWTAKYNHPSNVRYYDLVTSDKYLIGMNNMNLYLDRFELGDGSSPPEITSTPPSTVYTNREFRYNITVDHIETQNIYLISDLSWLSITDNGIADSLIAYYKFDNASNIGQCSLNSANDLILFDSANIVIDSFNDSPLSYNSGANFSSNTDGKGLITNNINFGNSTYTVSFWANQPSKDQCMFFSQGHHSTSTISYASSGSGKLYLKIDNTMIYPATHDTNITTTGASSKDAQALVGSWNMHTIVIRDDGLHKIYINGDFYSSVETANSSVKIFTNELNGYLVIGGQLNTGSDVSNPTEADLSADTNNDYQGYMQDFRIYSGELSEADIADLYNGNLVPNTAKLVGTPPADGNFDISIYTGKVILEANTEVSVNNGVYYFNNVPSSSSTFTIYQTGTYVFNNVPDGHPIAFLNNGKTDKLTYTGTTSAGSKVAQDGNSYEFFSGTVTVEVLDDFETISYECSIHGYMGGENNLVYGDNTNVVTQTFSLESITVPSSGTVAIVNADFTDNVTLVNGYIENWTPDGWTESGVSNSTNRILINGSNVYVNIGAGNTMIGFRKERKLYQEFSGFAGYYYTLTFDLTRRNNQSPNFSVLINDEEKLNEIVSNDTSQAEQRTITWLNNESTIRIEFASMDTSDKSAFIGNVAVTFSDSPPPVLIESWTSVNDIGQLGSGYRIATNESSGNYLLALSMSNSNVAGAQTADNTNYLYRSTDSGVTMTQGVTLNSGQFNSVVPLTDVAMDTTGKYQMIVGCRRDNGRGDCWFYYSTDYGASFDLAAYYNGVVNGDFNTVNQRNYTVAISDEIAEADSNAFFPCYIALGQYSGRRHVFNPVTNMWTEEDTNRNWCETSISKTGQYILFSCNGANSVYSKDYGETFTNIPMNELTGATGQRYYAADMSSDGQFMTFMSNYTIDKGYVFRTNDFGETWEQLEVLVTWKNFAYIQSLAIGKNGKNQIAFIESADGTNSRTIISTDYGMNWELIDQDLTNNPCGIDAYNDGTNDYFYGIDREGLLYLSQGGSHAEIASTPIITSIPPATASAGTEFTYNITVTPTDSANIENIYLISDLSWLSFTDNGDNTATLVGTPTAYGDIDISIYAGKVILEANTEVSENGGIYYFNNVSSSSSTFTIYKTGTYVFNNVPDGHPIAFLNNGKTDKLTYTGTTSAGSKVAQDGNSYEFFSGTVTVEVLDDFETISYECSIHGYMGGENNLVYGDYTNVEVQRFTLEVPLPASIISSWENYTTLTFSNFTNHILSASSDESGTNIMIATRSVGSYTGEVYQGWYWGSTDGGQTYTRSNNRTSPIPMDVDCDSTGTHFIWGGNHDSSNWQTSIYYAADPLPNTKTEWTRFKINSDKNYCKVRSMKVSEIVSNSVDENMPLFVAMSYTCGIMVYNPKEHKIYMHSGRTSGWIASTGGSADVPVEYVSNSDITSNTESGSFYDISISDTGRYILSVGNKIYLSKDFGKTFERIDTSITDWEDDCIAGDISSDGEFMTLCSKTSGKVFYSTNFGTDWNNTTIDGVSNDLTTVKISKLGINQIIGGKDGKSYASTNYGQTWAPLADIDSTLTIWDFANKRDTSVEGQYTDHFMAASSIQNQANMQPQHGIPDVKAVVYLPKEPTFTSTPETSVIGGNLYTYNITVTDEENEITSIEGAILPSWLTITDNGDNTATLSGTPSDSDIGTTEIMIKAQRPSDGGKAFQEYVLSIDSTTLLVKGWNTIGSISSLNGVMRMVTNSDSGQYILTVSTNNDDWKNGTSTHNWLYVRISNDYGVSWRSQQNFGGLNFTTYRFTDCAIDATGQYQILAGHENGQQNMYVSTDFGDTWTRFNLNQTNLDNDPALYGSGNFNLSSRNTCMISISNIVTGTHENAIIPCYISFVVYDNYRHFYNPITHTWTEDASETSRWLETDISKDGQHVLCVRKDKNSVFSNDYGVTFNEIPFTNTSFKNQNWFAGDMSENGQYMTLMANYTTDTAYVLRTGDYGLNWVEMTLSLPLKNSAYTYCITVGKTGKNQMVVLKSQENENSRIYFSIDYGMTWNTHFDIDTANSSNLTAVDYYTSTEGDDTFDNYYIMTNKGYLHSGTKTLGSILSLPPEFNSNPVLTGIEGEVYTYNVTISYDQIVAITGTTLPDWMTLTDNGDNTATLSGTPNEYGSVNIVLSAAGAIQLFTIEIDTTSIAVLDWNTISDVGTQNGIFRMSTNADGGRYLLAVSMNREDWKQNQSSANKDYVFRSENSGDSWKNRTSGFNANLNDAYRYTDCSLDTTGQYQVLTGYGNNATSLYFSKDGGANWTNIDLKQSNIDSDSTTYGSGTFTYSNSNAAISISNAIPGAHEDSIIPCYISLVQYSGKRHMYNPLTHTWTEDDENSSKWFETAVSKNGQYVLITRRDKDSIFSSDYGVSFTSIPMPTLQDAVGQDWYAADISENGQYMTLVAGYTTDVVYVYRTGDYGENWDEISLSLPRKNYSTPYSVSVGGIGKNQMIVFKDQEDNQSRVYYSADYGVTWILGVDTDIEERLTAIDNFYTSKEGTDDASYDNYYIMARNGNLAKSVRALGAEYIVPQETGDFDDGGSFEIEGNRVKTRGIPLKNRGNRKDVLKRMRTRIGDDSKRIVIEASDFGETDFLKRDEVQVVFADSEGSITLETSDAVYVVMENGEQVSMTLNSGDVLIFDRISPAQTNVFVNDTNEIYTTLADEEIGSYEGFYWKVGSILAFTLDIRSTYSSVIFSSGIKSTFNLIINIFNITKLANSIDNSNSSHENFDFSTAGYIQDSEITITDAGTNYVIGDTVQAQSSNNGSGAVLRIASVDEDGAVESLTVLFGGQTYTDNEVLLVGSDSQNGSGLALTLGNVGTDSVTIATVTNNLVTRSTIIREYAKAFNKSASTTEYNAAFGDLENLADEWKICITRAIDSIALAFPDTPQEDDNTTLPTNTSSASLNTATINTATEETKGALFMKIKALENYIYYSCKSLTKYVNQLAYRNNSPLAIFLSNYLIPIDNAFKDLANDAAKFVKETEFLFTMLKLGTFITDGNISSFRQSRTNILNSIDIIHTTLVNLKENAL